MTAPSALLPCERCGRVSAEAAGTGRFTFCPGCELYVCGDCWIGSHDRCRGCAMPEAIQQVTPSRIMVRETIGVAPREPADGPRQMRTFEVGVLDRTAAVARPRRRRDGARWRSAGRSALALAIRTLAATVLAIFLTASIWAVELAMRSEERKAIVAIPLPEVSPVASAPAALPSAPPSDLPTRTIYVVRPGDTLRGIARRMLGDEVRWTEIVDANGGRIDDPDNLRIGSELRLPTS